MKVKAIVEPNANPQLFDKGYIWTVVVVDESDDIIDLLDFKTKEEAENKAKEINDNPEIEAVKDLTKFY